MGFMSFLKLVEIKTKAVTHKQISKQLWEQQRRQDPPILLLDYIQHSLLSAYRQF